MYRPPVDSETWRSLSPSDKVALVQSVYDGTGTASRIAAAIGPAITRNAVIGVYTRNPELAKTHPLGPNLSQRKMMAVGKAARAKKMKAPAKKEKASKPPADIKLPPSPPPEPVKPPEFRNVSLVALKTGECKWPSGDPRTEDFGFCGAATGDILKPYCAHHTHIANIPIKKGRG